MLAAPLWSMVACAEPSAPRVLPRSLDCTVPAVTAYTQRVADVAGFSFSESFSAPAKESATVMVWLRADGSLQRAAVVKASSEKAHEHALATVRSASPYPPPPASYRPCLVGKPFTLVFLVDRQLDCDEIPEVVAYSNGLHRRVLDHLDTRGRAIGFERVLLQIFLDSDGSVGTLSVLESPSPEAAAAATAAVDAADPFPPPPEYSRCFSKLPYLLWLGVSTR